MSHLIMLIDRTLCIIHYVDYLLCQYKSAITSVTSSQIEHCKTGIDKLCAIHRQLKI